MRKLFIALFAVVLMITKAQAISIAPIPIELKSTQKTATLILEATSDFEAGKVFEVKAYKWSPKDNSYTETGDLIIYPKTSKLPAHFKITLRQKSFESEQTFRIVVKEVIQKEIDGINFTMVYDIPVFVRPIKVSENVKVDCLKDSIVVTNTGNITLKVTEVDNQGTVIYLAPQDSKTIPAKKIKIKDQEYCVNQKEV